MKNNTIEIKLEHIVAGTMMINNKREVTYDEIHKFIKDLLAKAYKQHLLCYPQFSTYYLRELGYDYGDVFYIGKQFISLQKGYDLDYLNKHFLAYLTLDKLELFGIINLQEQTKNLESI